MVNEASDRVPLNIEEELDKREEISKLEMRGFIIWLVIAVITVIGAAEICYGYTGRYYSQLEITKELTESKKELEDSINEYKTRETFIHKVVAGYNIRGSELKEFNEYFKDEYTIVIQDANGQKIELDELLKTDVYLVTSKEKFNGSYKYVIKQIGEIVD